MENILIVLGILILGSALGGTQLPKLPGAILSLGAIALLFFNSNALNNMASTFFIFPIILVIVGVMSFMAEKRVAKEGENASKITKLMAGSIFQVLFIVAVTFYFVSTFFFPIYS